MTTTEAAVGWEASRSNSGMKRITSSFTTSALEKKLHSLKERSSELSQSLTQQLATSRSGQNLLHIGPSLSTLPPDLQSLLSNLRPLLEEVETFEESCRSELNSVKDCISAIEACQRRTEQAEECGRMYEDLVSGERDVGNPKRDISSLERSALTTLHLVQELHGSSSGSGSSTEKAQFLLKLAPRIRHLESDTVKALTCELESLLKNPTSDLYCIGHCLRGLALLGRGKEAETTFATVAIMPIIGSKVSMGRLDEGGRRGECSGLFSLLDDIACSISKAFGPVLTLSESIFNVDPAYDMEIDLVTAGVWVPMVTALLADVSMKMAIFSPGIASVFQANYSAFDLFLSELADRLLTEDKNNSARSRIYTHPATTDFFSKWNLPIYYQLRFGECCERLNTALSVVQREGWYAPVFTSDSQDRHPSEIQLPIFHELYDVLLSLWSHDVILRPLTHRFLRGALQLIARTLAFVQDGLKGKILFQANNEDSYEWSLNANDLASVAWELHLLQSFIVADYPTIISNVVAQNKNSNEPLTELRILISEVFVDSSQQISPVIDNIWNERIVGLLIESCSKPLQAVKGVAATYRMTNRPPPTQPSPFVSTILSPLQQFDKSVQNYLPPQVLPTWKQTVVSTVSSKYSVAVEELMETVKRTEVALKNRKSRLVTMGVRGMSDGDKVRLQLTLDYNEFAQNVKELNVDFDPQEFLPKLQ